MKKSLLILIGGAVALVLAVVIFVLTLDINTYKPRIEAAASEATGMTVRINGAMKFTLFPRGHISLEDILIQNKGADVVTAKKAEMDIGRLPLLRREIHIQQVILITPKLFVTKDRKGRFNFETPEKKSATGLFGMEKIFIKGGHIFYLDEKSGEKTAANECDLAIKNIARGRGGSPDPFSFEGDLSCGEVTTAELRVSDIRVAMKAHGGKFKANPVTMKIFGGDGKGSIKGVLTGETPEYSVDFTVTKFRFEEVLGTFKQKQTIRGELDLKSHLTVKGNNADEMKRTAHGDISLRGQNLLFEGMDLDDVLEKYDKSQQFSLVDVAAFFITGPLVGTLLAQGFVSTYARPLGSTLLTKGYGFGSTYKKTFGGKSTIRKLVSDWTVKNGIAEAEDAAFTTSKNRISLKGRLDFVHERFEDITIAVLDAKGCAKYSQRIDGSFNDPRIEKPSTLHMLLGPIRSLGEKTAEMFSGGGCKAFYHGSLAQP